MSIIKSVKCLDGKFDANIEMFDSTMECVKFCREREKTDDRFDNDRDYNKKWYGVKSYDEALQLMNDGWKEEVGELQTILKECKQLQTDKRISFKNDVCGFAPIVPLSLLRVPNSMINSHYKPIKSKVVSIYYDMTVSCGYNAPQITDNGKKMVEAIIKLENMGYRVNFNIIQGYTDEMKGDFLIIKIKNANQHLDLKRICFPAIHAAMFRVIGFDWYSKFPKGKYRYGYGHNVVQELNDDYKKVNKFTKDLLGKDAIYVAAKIIQDKDVDYIVEVLKEGKYEI